MNEARNIAEMTGTYGGSPTLEMLQWVEQTNQQAAENARSNAYLAIAQQQAAAAGRDIIQLGDTYYEYDPAQGFDASAVAIYTEPARATGGGSTTVPYGQNAYDSIIAEMISSGKTIDQLAAERINVGTEDVPEIVPRFFGDDLNAIADRYSEVSPEAMDQFYGPYRY